MVQETYSNLEGSRLLLRLTHGTLPQNKRVVGEPRKEAVKNATGKFSKQKLTAVMLFAELLLVVNRFIKINHLYIQIYIYGITYAILAHETSSI